MSDMMIYKPHLLFLMSEWQLPQQEIPDISFLLFLTFRRFPSYGNIINIIQCHPRPIETKFYGHIGRHPRRMLKSIEPLLLHHGNQLAIYKDTCPVVPRNRMCYSQNYHILLLLYCFIKLYNQTSQGVFFCAWITIISQDPNIARIKLTIFIAPLKRDSPERKLYFPSLRLSRLSLNVEPRLS